MTRNVPTVIRCFDQSFRARRDSCTYQKPRQEIPPGKNNIFHYIACLHRAARGYTAGLGDYMYQELSYDRRTPEPLTGPTLVSAVAYRTPLQSQSRAAAAHALDDILRLMDTLSVKIAHYTVLHATTPAGSEDSSADNDAALAWMQTSLEDIEATLKGLSANPRAK